MIPARRVFLPRARTEERISARRIFTPRVAPEERVLAARLVKQAGTRADESVVCAGRVRLSGTCAKERIKIGIVESTGISTEK